jgi:hypothetical protein
MRETATLRDLICGAATPYPLDAVAGPRTPRIDSPTPGGDGARPRRSGAVNRRAGAGNKGADCDYGKVSCIS